MPHRQMQSLLVPVTTDEKETPESRAQQCAVCPSGSAPMAASWRWLLFGAMLLRKGVDRRDVAAATVAALRGAIDGKFGLFRTIVHSDHHMMPDIVRDFHNGGVAWCETHVPGAKALLEKYAITLPASVEQHDLSEAARVLGWTSQVSFTDFLRDLTARDARRRCDTTVGTGATASA